MSFYIAFFISSHGYGHAARCAAVIDKLKQADGRLNINLFTEIPEWFFRQSLPHYTYHVHHLFTDVGLKQWSPLEEDLPGTVHELKRFRRDMARKSKSILDILERNDCRLIVCDISPFGLHLARQTVIPSILIENFTWDWIYRGYVKDAPGLEPFIDLFGDLFRSADYHLQSEPVCRRIQDAHMTNPISREPRISKISTREALNIPQHQKAVLISMGGVPTQHRFLDKLKQFTNVYFILPHDVSKRKEEDNLVILPHHSHFYHPDLVHCADAVIGKLGYSTLAEIYHSGRPYGFIPRDRFPESPPLAQFVKKHMQGIEIEQSLFTNGNWHPVIEPLLDLPLIKRQELNGSAQTASCILHHLKSTTG
ncbi:MAG: hypothetical protein GF313_05430 [Caldithrix sp.]|nr:hypothetical protein [Caldithrix sp.]